MKIECSHIFPAQRKCCKNISKLKNNLDSFALPRNLTIYTRNFQGDADESNFWQCSLILKRTWLEDKPYYLIKLLSKNQVIDSIRKLKHLNYLYRKNRKRMSYKWSCIVLNNPDQLYSYSSPPKIGSPLKRSISIH